MNEMEIANNLIVILTTVSMFLALVVILLIAVILLLVQKYGTCKFLDRTEQTIGREIAGAEHRIERLVAEARAAMFEAVNG